MRFAAILDGTKPGAGRQALTLARFLGGGLSASATGETILGETILFYEDGRERDRLVALAPTADVRLVRVPGCRPEGLAGVLADLPHDDVPDLFLLAGGAGGAEIATRLAHRIGGSVLTDVLTARREHGRLVARTSVYSNHLTGRFELAAPPWCLALDASWAEGASRRVREHRVVCDTEALPDEPSSAFRDVEVREPVEDDLAQARFVVIAGRGAGSRAAVERMAGAARRMGAAFAVTRPVAMNAWAPADRLVGVSGRRIAPALCLVVGASGAPAFLWGVERAGTIVAVNCDEHAPILAGADLAVLDDGLAVVEALAALVTPAL